MGLGIWSNWYGDEEYESFASERNVNCLKLSPFAQKREFDRLNDSTQNALYKNVNNW